MLRWFMSLLLIGSPLFAHESITGHYGGYRQACLRAATDPEYFKVFRSMGEFRSAFEITEGIAFARYVTASDKLLARLEDFRRLETVGSPYLEKYSVLGEFSATTLRYICLADQIRKMVALPANPVIAEIGAGCGGQCYILSQLHPFSKYYFFDLPEVEALIGKVMEALDVKNTYCIPMEEELPEERIDLVISNYAFSECDREMQLEYFNRIIRKADRGYFIYNQIVKDHNFDSLTSEEFIQLLKEHGLRPKVYQELLSTAPGNLLITWNRVGNTRGKSS